MRRYLPADSCEGRLLIKTIIISDCWNRVKIVCKLSAQGRLDLVLSYCWGMAAVLVVISKKKFVFLIICIDFLNLLRYHNHINEILLRLDFYNVQSEENSNMRYWL